MNTSPELTLSGVLDVGALDNNRIPLTSALQLSLQVVRLVAETHDRGQVVGVLDASHLVCTPNGALSFGGNSDGNPIAPELKRGEMPDRLTDVYALGALMYRMLTGRRLDPSRVIEPPSHFNPAVDTCLDDLVLSALDEDPSERPYSARDLEQRLLGVYDELGLGDSKTEMTKLISERAKAKRPLMQKTVSDKAPRKAAVYVPPQRAADPDLTADSDVPDDDDDWQPQLDRNPLEKKWLLGGVAVVALVLIAFVAWPSHHETPRHVEEDAPAQVAKPEPKVEVRLVEPTAPAATDTMKVKKLTYAPGPKKAESPKKSTRRARR